MTFEDLQKANESISATRLENKKTGEYIGDYVEVNQRIKAFRMLYPEGTIETTMLSNENGVCVFKASIYAYKQSIPVSRELLLGTGTAYEKENSTFINKTSYIENCETSAVGRALAMCGIGIDKSIASAEEVQNAVENHEITVDDALKFVFEKGKYKGKKIAELYDEDKGYLQWWLDQGNNKEIKQMIMLITDLKPTIIPSEEEQIKQIIKEINKDYKKNLFFEYKSPQKIRKINRNRSVLSSAKQRTHNRKISFVKENRENSLSFKLIMIFRLFLL